MKIAYDLRILGEGMHGMARYGLELLRALLEAEPALEIEALLRRPADAALLPAHTSLRVAIHNLAPYGLAAQIRLPAVLRALKPDIYFCPFYAPPVLYGRAMVLTIHDLIHLRFPKDHGLKHWLFYRLVTGAAAVFTVSQHSRQDIVEFLSVDPRRVVITANAAGPAFRPLTPQRRNSAAQELGLPPNFILGVGNPKPHKNLSALIEAHRRLDHAAPALVLVGLQPGQLPQAQPGPGMIILPRLEDRELALAYGAARVVVIPSLYEGFGLPALEALACGTPLIASNRASLPEVVGQAGLLVEPDPRSLARAMGQVLANQELRQRLAQAGPIQAARFSWREAAHTALAVFRGVAEGVWP
ncbi:mannosyl-N-acetyl-alpha-D-glucosaminyl-diphospho-ditrans,octacis-undecaprenol 3-alpha-mannosyltransferase / alpha-1,3-rhamnosyltransferase [Desulfarculales bacterium]